MSVTPDVWHSAMTRPLLWFHLGLWVILAAYGLHRLRLILLYRRLDTPPVKPPSPTEWPRVTVQLPIYNERYVVDRLLEAAGALDYPPDRLEIQVLDDSTDETREIAARKIAELRARGRNAVHLRRGERTGYKAGALQYGLERAHGEFLAIFDADFVPPPSILREMVPHFGDPGVGMVQARWQHLNRDYSLLARVQAISLDGHFLIEHAARMKSDCYFNFNGTAGILRKRCLIEAGGWQSDTLTEDLDLSYRAQLRGWKFIYTPHVGCPAELPVEMNAFKAQQHRWVRGSIQVARKLLPQIWRSPAPLRVKLEATFHLTANVPYVLILILALIVYPVVLARYETKSLFFTVSDTLLLLAATSPVLVYFGTAQRRALPRGKLRDIPFVMMLGIGLAVNNTRAVLEGLVCPSGAFHRTPKFQIERRSDLWRRKRYRAPVSVSALVELALGGYFLWAMMALVQARLYAPIPFFLLYLVGFLYVGVLSLAHALRRA